MKIHTSAVLPELLSAANHASNVSGSPVTLARCDVKGSRSHPFAYDVVLTGDGSANRRRTQGREGFSATWDQWGWFLSALYAVDPDAKAGPYANVEDFDRKTDGKYSAA